MRTLTAAVLVGLLFSAGCFSFKAPDIYLGSSPSGGSEGGGSSPAQLPASDGGGGGWRYIARSAAGKLFLDSDQGVVFYAFDTLAYPNQPVDLVAQLLSAHDMGAIAGATVSFYDGEKLLGEADTDKKGRATIQWTPPASKHYQFTARIIDVPPGVDETVLVVKPAPLLVASRNLGPGTRPEAQPP